MRRVDKILMVLAVLWIATLLVVVSDPADGDDWLVTGTLLAGSALVLAWLVLLGVALWGARHGEKRPTLAPLVFTAAIVAGGVGLGFTDLPFRARFALSEPALTACAIGRGDCGRSGLFRIQSVDRDSGATIRLVIGLGGGFAYSPDGPPLETTLDRYRPIQGPWYRWTAYF